MERSEYNEKFGDLEFNVSAVNQYVLKIYFESNVIHIPTRDSIAGMVAYLPRDEEFDLKTEARLILRFETDYLPVLTPSAEIEDYSEDTVVISYNR